MAVENVTIEALPTWVAAAISAFGPVTRKHVVAAAHQGRNAILETIDRHKPFPPVDRGAYRKSWRAEETPTGAVIYSDAPHAVFIERGTRPHWPPVRAIVEWVKRKRLARKGEERGLAFVIARAIARRGMRPYRIADRTLPRIREILDREVQKALVEAVEGKGTK